MCNHCFNSMWINGRKSDTDKIARWLKGGKFFEHILKTPKALLDTTSTSMGEPGSELWKRQTANMRKYMARDWYDWRCANWGTKRDAFDIYIMEQADGFLYFTFSTARSPAEKVYEKLAEKFPDCKIRVEYSEEGCGFSGVDVYEGGELVNSENYDDAYFGNGIKCEKCGCIYDGSNSDEWSSEWICQYCGE